MATNSYFATNTTGFAASQNLYESLIIENIQISGQNYFYVPRTLSQGVDDVFGEDNLSSFDSCVEIEMYLSDFSGWGGEQEMISKFGFEVRNTASFTIARKRFADTVTPILPATRSAILKLRPCEGDLIYAPFSGSLFEIKFVDDENPVFYQLNKKYIWTLRCELVQLNNEKFNTGNPDIDAFGVNLDRLNSAIVDESANGILTEDGGVLIDETYTTGNAASDQINFGNNDKLKKEFIDILNFDSNNPFSERF